MADHEPAATCATNSTGEARIPWSSNGDTLFNRRLAQVMSPWRTGGGMTTFDSTKTSLDELLREVSDGRIQLPDFQRGWVWDDDHIRQLLVSIAQAFPIGAVMLLQTGGDVRFQTRPVEGLELSQLQHPQPERLILDGQQRITTLTQALKLTGPVQTRTSKGKDILRHYYFDIKTALEGPRSLEDSVIAVDENKRILGDFGRTIELDLSTTELECLNLHFPCSQILQSDAWEAALHKIDPDGFNTYMQFRNSVLRPFRDYQLPVILLKRETTKEAVCVVFEKVNTGGVPLSVFELITASYAADGYNLRDDWYGSSIRDVESRLSRIEAEALLKGTQATEFLQAISLLYTHDIRNHDLQNGKKGKAVRPVSAKRADVLELPLSAWTEYASALESGFLEAGRFLRRECFYDRRDLPYSTQLVPLAAVMTRIGERWREPRILDKLSQWFWCGVLGELYGGAVETRIANDYEELLRWFEEDASVPRTVRDANFQPERFDTLRSRLSAAYKGINVLVLREGAQDWFWKAGIRDLDRDDVNLDIHHIFPKAWCDERAIPKDAYDCILNKTPISFKANRKIGGQAPSVYVEKIQGAKEVLLTSDEMDMLLASHALDPALMRSDSFDEFLGDRRKRLLLLVEGAMRKGHLSESRQE